MGREWHGFPALDEQPYGLFYTEQRKGGEGEKVTAHQVTIFDVMYTNETNGKKTNNQGAKLSPQNSGQRIATASSLLLYWS